MQGEDKWGSAGIKSDKHTAPPYFRDGVVDGLARSLGRPIQLEGSWLERNPVGAWIGRSYTTYLQPGGSGLWTMDNHATCDNLLG